MIEHAYVHIPFCNNKCKYCSFVSGYNLSKEEEYMQALLVQIKNEYKNEKIKTLYIGGGTPSLLKIENINKILNCFNLRENAEVTIEANPESVNYEKFYRLKQTKINRISIGIQTFNDEILNIIGRRHSKSIILNSVKIIKSCGFDNISTDLIYGLPTQNKNMLIQDLEEFVKLDVQHISTYGLKIEENSFFGKHIPKNLPDDEQQAEMFLLICDFLKKNNFTHYEISNFAKNGLESHHNNSYWRNKEYYGFGLNASGYKNNIRYRNTSSFKKYIINPTLKDEEHTLFAQETMENEIFLALRLKNGINIPQLNTKFNIDFEKKYKSVIKKYTELELLKIENNHCKLTQNGILLSNDIMCEFID